MEGFDRKSRNLAPLEGTGDMSLGGTVVSDAKPAPPPGAELAAWLLMARRLREEVLGAKLFSDPAWDILLDIYAAEARGERIQISSLAPMSGVPSSTARRWAHRLEVLGLLERDRDARDQRLSYIRLSQYGRDRIMLFIERLIAKGSPPPIVR